MGFRLWLYCVCFVLLVVLAVAATTESVILTVLAGVGSFIGYYVVVKFLLGLADKGGQALQRKLDQKFDEKYRK